MSRKAKYNVLFLGLDIGAMRQAPGKIACYFFIASKIHALPVLAAEEPR